MNKILIPAALALLEVCAPALTITIDAEVLKTFEGDPVPVSGVVVLTAGLAGAFPGPIEGSFAKPGELVLQIWDLSAWDTAGVFSAISDPLSLGGDWNEGDPLALYWYPGLSLVSGAPAAGARYGFYRSDTGLDGSAPWITPAAGASIDLKFFTSDAEFLFEGGSNPLGDGLAWHTVSAPVVTGGTPVPEPSTGLVAALLLGSTALRMGRKKPPVLAA